MRCCQLFQVVQRGILPEGSGERRTSRAPSPPALVPTCSRNPRNHAAWRPRRPVFPLPRGPLLLPLPLSYTAAAEILALPSFTPRPAEILALPSFTPRPVFLGPVPQPPPPLQCPTCCTRAWGSSGWMVDPPFIARLRVDAVPLRKEAHGRRK